MNLMSVYSGLMAEAVGHKMVMEANSVVEEDEIPSETSSSLQKSPTSDLMISQMIMYMRKLHTLFLDKCEHNNKPKCSDLEMTISGDRVSGKFVGQKVSYWVSIYHHQGQLCSVGCYVMDPFKSCGFTRSLMKEQMDKDGSELDIIDTMLSLTSIYTLPDTSEPMSEVIIDWQINNLYRQLVAKVKKMGLIVHIDTKPNHEGFRLTVTTPKYPYDYFDKSSVSKSVEHLEGINLIELRRASPIYPEIYLLTIGRVNPLKTYFPSKITNECIDLVYNVVNLFDINLPKGQTVGLIGRMRPMLGDYRWLEKYSAEMNVSIPTIIQEAVKTYRNPLQGCCGSYVPNEEVTVEPKN